MGQMSLFSAAAHEPRLADLDGLLAGPGQVVRRGATARISVVVADEWRVEALTAEMALVGVAAEHEPAQDTQPAQPGSTTVRTPWLAELRPVADAWTAGAVKRPPAHWSLDGARLRWWCLAAGSGQPGLYSLALGVSDEPAWQPIGAALAASGVPGVLVGPRADGPAYRVVGQRRLARLRELVGDPPDGAPEAAWPTLIPR